MAAREDQAELVVLNALLVGPGRRILDGDVGRVPHIVKRVEALAASQAVDGLEASGGYEPCARIGRHTVPRPLLDGCPEGVVQRFLGDVEVAEQADQRGQHASRIRKVDGIHRLERRMGRRHGDPFYRVLRLPAGC